MAIIKKIEKTNNYNMKNSLTFCNAEYNEYYYNNEKFVRIQTFGSDERKEKGRQSQVIHLNRDTAIQLVKLLSNSFNIQ